MQYYWNNPCAAWEAYEKEQLTKWSYVYDTLSHMPPSTKSAWLYEFEKMLPELECPHRRKKMGE